MQTKKRPVFLDLQQIKLPLPGIVSILHRISGVILFIMLPILLALLGGSLSSDETFDTYKAWADNFFIKLILIGVLWAFMHHMLAGMRFLLLDAHKGLALQTARATAKAVFVAAIVLTVVIAGVCLL